MKKEESDGFLKKTLNTLGGVFQENRGRRSASEAASRRDEIPFENGRLRNWNHRQGWDPFYERKRSRQGGAQLDHGHAGRGPRGYTRSDDAIYEDVCEILTRSSGVDASNVEVRVRDGIVTLEGTIGSRDQKRLAELVIENVSGVHDVQNLLTLGHEERPSA